MPETLYERIASGIREQIGQGLYRPGDRLPSVRHQRSQLGVSASTVLQAYGQLQDQRLIEARPQSGYFVSQPVHMPPPPTMSKPVFSPAEVTVSGLVMEVVQAIEAPDMIQFGAALPNTTAPAIGRVHRMLARAARSPRNRNASYAFPPGLPELRLQIARRAVDAGCSVSPDEVIITNGCQEALVLCLRAVAAPGDTVAIESPSFYGVLQAIESLGMKALEIPTHPLKGISLEALELATEQWPIKACVLTPAFSNPLGYCMPDDKKEALARLLEKKDLPLIEDDLYGELGYGPSRPRTIKSWDQDGRVMLCSSVSKTLEPGLRVGWTSPGRYFQKIEHLKLVTSMATATLPQVAVADYLENGGYDRHLRSMRSQYRRNRDICINLIARYFPEGTRVTRPEGGFLAWVELPGNADAMTLYHQAMAQRISITPGPLFSPKNRFRNHIRINYALDWNEGREQAIEKLGKLLSRML